MRKRREEAGFTLLEMVVVVLIISLVAGGIALSIGATDQAQLRSSAWTIAAAARFAYSHAVTQGVTTRLVLDFESRTVRVEETRGRVVLNREDETGEGLRREGDEAFEGDGGVSSGSLLDQAMNAIGSSLGKSSTGAASEPNNAASGTAPGLFGMGLGGGLGCGLGGGLGGGLGADQGSSAGNPAMASLMENFTGGNLTDPFLSSMQAGLSGSPTGYRRPHFSALQGKRGEPRELEGDTAFAQVFTPHSPTAQTEGRAFIYFFPGGMTEHSIVQLSDGDERVYSVEIHPLTGQSVIFTQAIEPSGDIDELNEAKE